VDFRDDLTAREVEDIVARVEGRVREAHPEIVSLLIKPQSAAAFAQALRPHDEDEEDGEKKG
ncbi:MAG TPA: cation transporter, partial [Vicinamibacteria bacterium]|nr:cation transporter [Vicinamibacteria bacterium]